MVFPRVLRRHRGFVRSREAEQAAIRTTTAPPPYVAEALRAGAAGFLLKTTEPRALLQALRDCAEGRTALSPAVLDRLVASFVNRPEPVDRPAWLAELTPREREVLCSLAGGRSNAEIARHLHLAETTVKTHVARVLAKLQVRDRVQAAVLAQPVSLAVAPFPAATVGSSVRWRPGQLCRRHSR